MFGLGFLGRLFGNLGAVARWGEVLPPEPSEFVPTYHILGF